jgi:hypothetical protein
LCDQADRKAARRASGNSDEREFNMTVEATTLTPVVMGENIPLERVTIRAGVEDAVREGGTDAVDHE